MKLSKLLEGAAQSRKLAKPPHASMHHQILEYIHKAQRKFGNSLLYGGNCGTFAKSIIETIKSPLLRYAILFRDDESIVDENTLLNAETDIYHIVVEYNNKFYDGDGEITPNELLHFAKTEYNDYYPGFLSDIAPSKVVNRIIDNDTNWTLSVQQFLKVLG